jgi:UDP-N-acetylmuramoyl-tripeptide--D-alanyl-D-alanine ligase
MITLSLAALSAAIDGELINPDQHQNTSISNILIDSRLLQAGDVFLALKGDNFDGHAFIDQVIKKGGGAIIVEQQIKESIVGDTAQIIVKNSHTALGKIGAYIKAQISPKTVGITGSSGKTTVKEMVAAILSRLGKVLATKGNFNNDIGVPLTLLRLTPEHEFAVIEMGANHQGEIAYSTHLVKPDIALINNVAAAHLEGFGSIEGVAIAKGEIFTGLPAQGLAIYQNNSPYINVWKPALTDKNVQVFSNTTLSSTLGNTFTNTQGCFSSNIEINAQGCASFILHCAVEKNKGTTPITLSLPGKHNVDNALAAATICIALGATFDDIRLALATMAQVKGRTNVQQLSETITLVDDTYNANVDSVKASIDVLASLPGQKVFILGDMGELGDDAKQCHKEIGEYAGYKNVNCLLTLGELTQLTSSAFSHASSSKGTHARINQKTIQKTNDIASQTKHFTELEPLVKAIKQQFTSDIFAGKQALSIVVKGSRSAKMENVVAAIQDWFLEQNAFTSSENTKENVNTNEKSNANLSKASNETTFDKESHNNKKEEMS